ncbi:NAD(P)-dependent dehydrogenase (short-subunit alcohol dehydrogenase family) [Lewinella marina]|nr:hypothetical protein [Neolewinella marina]NJB87104.1 NAD(P)-dependent dehydrogenase (short-subunit alcohol dehydrogenase family) [Neolewinella marina]
MNASAKTAGGTGGSRYIGLAILLRLTGRGVASHGRLAFYS